MAIDFVNPGTVGPFRYWCQKVLPAVYDDSLSYYELLCKVSDYLNQVIELTNTQSDAITELQTVVEDFLEMEVDPYIEELVNQWFEKNQPQIVSDISTLKTNVQTLTTRENETSEKLDRLETYTRLSKANIICIGDSYGRGVGGINNPPNDMRGWPYYMDKVIGFNTFVNVSNSGAGFVNTGHSSEYGAITFTGQLTYAYDHLSTLAPGLTADDVNIIFVGGGYNDHGESYADIYAGCSTFCAYAKAHFPNAKIYFAPLCTGKVSLNPANEYLNAYYSQIVAMELFGATVYEQALYILMSRPNFYCRATDSHPSDDGHKRHGYELANMLAGGNLLLNQKYFWTAEDEGYTWESDVTPSGNFRYGCVDNTWVMKGAITIESWNGWTAKKIGTLPTCMIPKENTFVIGIVYNFTKPAVCRVALENDGDIIAYSCTAAESASSPGAQSNVQIWFPMYAFPMGSVM